VIGLFDYLRSSYPIGEHLTDVQLQTKDLVCCMDHFYIDPAGQLFSIDYDGVADLIPEPDSTSKFFPYKRVPNGSHGKVTPVLMTGDVRVYNADGDAFYESTILFLRGKIVEVLPEVKWTIPSHKIIQFSTDATRTLRQTDLDYTRS
jgi:hypothetical protein